MAPPEHQCGQRVANSSSQLDYFVLPRLERNDLYPRVRCDVATFSSPIKAIRRDLKMSIDLTTRPADFNICFFQISQPSVHAQVVAGKITVASPHLEGSLEPPSSDSNPCSYATAIAFYALST